jgi:hypothetical protein
MAEPTRVELDFPNAYVSFFGHVEIPGEKNLESIVASMFERGQILTVHIIVESTPDHRTFCEWQDTEHSYNQCHNILDSNGRCANSKKHADRDRELLQPQLIGDSE